MLIRYLCAFAGPSVSIAVGDVRDVEDAEAARLIAAGFAEPAAPASAPAQRREKAARGPDETR